MNEYNLSQIVNKIQRSNLDKKIIPMAIKGIHLYYEKRVHALAKEQATPAKAKVEKVAVQEPIVIEKKPRVRKKKV